MSYEKYIYHHFLVVSMECLIHICFCIKKVGKYLSLYSKSIKIKLRINQMKELCKNKIGHFLE